MRAPNRGITRHVFGTLVEEIGVMQKSAIQIMKENLSYKDILTLLKAEKAFLRNEFGVINIGLFGSYVKGNQRADSDIDLLVELKEPRFDWIAGLQIYLEKKFDRKIELVRKSDNVNRRFTQRIEKELIYA